MRTLRILTSILVLGLGGCVTPDTKYSQTALNALETREFDYSFDDTFNAAVNALFDAGYSVGASDKRGGFLRASRWGSGSVQIKVDQTGPKRTSVRISTASGGQAHVDKPRIDELLNLIDRRLTGSDAKLMVPPPKGGS
jgi:hypothetical protein